MDACGRQQEEKQRNCPEKTGRAFRKADDHCGRRGSAAGCSRVRRHEQTEENAGEKKTESEK